MSVNVKIDIDGNPKQTWYTNEEYIKGRVSLDLRSCVEVSGVNVSLYGISETTLTRVDDFGQKFTDHVNETSVFLNLETRVFPPQDQVYGAKYSLRAGNHTWPFEFVFPRQSTSLEKRPLPPSLSDVDEDMASIRYFLKANVTYSSNSSLRAIGGVSNGSSSSFKPIVFLPSDDATLDALPTYGVFHTQSSRVVSSTKTMSGLFSRIVTTLAHDRAPTCSGIGIFTVRSELLITPGLKFSCAVDADTPSAEKLFVTAIRIDLVAKTYVRAKNVDKNMENVTTLLDKKCLNLEGGDILSKLDSSALILPDSTPPTFSSANLRREYRFEFKLKWSHRPTSALTHKAFLSRKIWVRSGMHALPNYETGEIVRANREFPQAKWYFST